MKPISYAITFGTALAFTFAACFLSPVGLKVAVVILVLAGWGRTNSIIRRC
jgi:hypothetical protein